MNTFSILAILTLMSLSFGAGWVMRGKKDDDDWEPMNNQEDQTRNPFVK